MASTGEGMMGDERNGVLERFVLSVAGGLPESIAVTLLRPWNLPHGPIERVVAPSQDLVPGTPESVVTEMETKLRGREPPLATVLMPCTLDDEFEVPAVGLLAPMLCNLPECVILVVQLSTRPTLTAELSSRILDNFDQMLELGVDDVIVDPGWDAQSVIRSVNVVRRTWEVSLARVQFALQQEPQLPTQEQQEVVERQHASLLWDALPAAMMPQFTPVNANLEETLDRVGGYIVVSRRTTQGGRTFLLAIDRSDPNKHLLRVIKMREKPKILAPHDLEEFYREYRITNDILCHPNIVRCFEMLHGNEGVYLAFQFAGKMNLLELLTASPGQRLEVDEAKECFQQLTAGLLHSHLRHIYHLHLTLRHIFVSETSDHRHYRIGDFSSSMMMQYHATHTTPRGELPFMAPEMATAGQGQGYFPPAADSWSMGAILLEMAGGLSAINLSCLSGEPVIRDTARAARRIVKFFERPGSHEQALALQGNVREPSFVAVLEQTLLPRPRNRALIINLVPTEEGLFL